MRGESAAWALAILMACGTSARAQTTTERARAAYAEGESRSRARDYPAARPRASFAPGRDGAAIVASGSF